MVAFKDRRKQIQPRDLHVHDERFEIWLAQPLIVKVAREQRFIFGATQVMSRTISPHLCAFAFSAA